MPGNKRSGPKSPNLQNKSPQASVLGLMRQPSLVAGPPTVAKLANIEAPGHLHPDFNKPILGDHDDDLNPNWIQSPNPSVTSASLRRQAESLGLTDLSPPHRNLPTPLSEPLDLDTLSLVEKIIIDACQSQDSQNPIRSHIARMVQIQVQASMDTHTHIFDEYKRRFIEMQREIGDQEKVIKDFVDEREGTLNRVAKLEDDLITLRADSGEKDGVIEDLRNELEATRKNHSKLSSEFKSFESSMKIQIASYQSDAKKDIEALLNKQASRPHVRIPSREPPVAEDRSPIGEHEGEQPGEEFFEVEPGTEQSGLWSFSGEGTEHEDRSSEFDRPPELPTSVSDDSWHAFLKMSRGGAKTHLATVWGLDPDDF